MSNAVQIPQNVLDQLDPEYRAFIQSSATLPPPIHKSEWSPAFRQGISGLDLGSIGPVEVGSTRTIQIGDFSVHLRVMTPPGEKPSRGWPVLLDIHGGGWVLGSATMDDAMLSKLCIGEGLNASILSLCTHPFMSQAPQCVTVSVDYRLAPEHPFPAGLNDSWDALIWLSTKGENEIGTDPKRIAIMGASAGGNLAAAVVQRASLASPPIPLVFQNLLVPTLNLSFSRAERDRWTSSVIRNEHIWMLPLADMFWLIDLYVPNVDDRTNPEVSPVFQNDAAAFRHMPPTWISVADMDVLCGDGEAYTEKLRGHSVPVTLKTLTGLPHSGFVADRVCAQVREYYEEFIERLNEAFV